MKYFLSVIIAAFAASSTVFAHCGACGSDGGEGHDHASADSAAGCSDKALLTYFKIQDALASDNLASAQDAAAKLQSAGESCSMKGKDCCAEMASAAQGIAQAGNIAAARGSFEKLSNDLIDRIEDKGLAHGQVVKMHCPMAMGGKGASWLQDTSEVRNPYYGASMLKCGMAKATIGEAYHGMKGAKADKGSCGEACSMACCADS